MDDYETPDDDIAAQMGFSSFGTQPKNKKRKTEQETSTQQTAAPASNHGATVNQAQATECSPSVTAEQNLGAYRNGVRNERGDMVYFMPSFIEDPWEHLRKDDNAR